MLYEVAEDVCYQGSIEYNLFVITKKSKVAYTNPQIPRRWESVNGMLLHVILLVNGGCSELTVHLALLFGTNKKLLFVLALRKFWVQLFVSYL